MTKTKKVKSGREIVIWALHRGKSNSEILTRVLKEHPKSPMTLATINFIRNGVRKDSPNVKSERALRRG